ncbi:hypothetical protein SAMN04490244_106245 [Tranquillimonas rosea]|uniref:Phosphoadenosine phosphosulfate reductase n=1 Tax=Tranquillimonas rosea TaxID=641238 RepID=A0A1H9V531_9RHOB|nr:hypothetical protein [Tranquillimonas rosea]SES16651.1 hypothetical protein SAMN04490244_106245 [Tranquillimonas rosea]
MSALDTSIPEESDEDMDGAQGADVDSFAYALDADHFIRFQRRGPNLLVSFEPTMDGETPLEAVTPRLDPLAQEMEWSTLSLVSRGHTWFRRPEVIGFFDALVDGTLLDQFENVLFYGASSGGHAALSFAITAPMARVLALAPQAALGPEAPWDTRFGGAANGVDFAARYVPSADHLEVAESILLPFDPTIPEDGRHAEALASDVTLPLQCRHLGPDLDATLDQLGVLDDIVAEAMEGTLTAQQFYTALRARHNHGPYLRRLVRRLDAAGRPYLEAIVVRFLAEQQGRKRYRKRLDELTAQLAGRGLHLPPQRDGAG